MIDTQDLVVVGFVYGEDKLIASLRPHQKSSASSDPISLNTGKEKSESKRDLICFKKLWDTPALLLHQWEASGDVYFPTIFSPRVSSGTVMYYNNAAS